MKKGHKKPLKILVVEDDPEILNSLNIALASIGFDIDVLQTGKPIFQNQFVVPDLIIVDKRLPDIDGLEICKYLKSRLITNRSRLSSFHRVLLSAVRQWSPAPRVALKNPL